MGNSHKNKSKKFQTLKRVIQYEIYSYLNFEDFLKFFKKLDKRFLSYFLGENSQRLKYLLILHIYKDLRGEKFEKMTKILIELSKNMTNFKEILCSILQPDPMYLPVIGYKTDGGYEKSFLSYTNIFSINPYTYYCSKPMYINLKVYGSFSSKTYDENKALCRVNIEKEEKKPSVCLRDLKKKFLRMKLKGPEYDMSIEDIFTFIVSFDDKKYDEREEHNIVHLVNRNKYKFSEENILDDSNILEDFPNKDCFFLNHIYFRNTAENYTCPSKTLIIFLQDEIKTSKEDEEFLNYFMYAYNYQILQSLVQSNLNLFVVNHHSNKDYGYVEFDTIYQKCQGMNSKVLLWITFTKMDHYIINLKPFYHLGKYVVINFIDKMVKTEGNNMDFSKVHFFGNCIKLNNN
jgi:hypothetical protein